MSFLKIIITRMKRNKFSESGEILETVFQFPNCIENVSPIIQRGNKFTINGESEFLLSF